MSASLLFASRLATKRCLMPSNRLFLTRLASSVPASSSSSTPQKQPYVYEYDKPAAQRYIEGRTKKIQEFQRFLDADHSTPIWWKTTFDKVFTVSIAAILVALLVNQIYTLYLYANGKL